MTKLNDASSKGANKMHTEPKQTNLGVFSRQVQLERLSAAECSEECFHVLDPIRLLVLPLSHLLVIKHLLDFMNGVLPVGVHGVVEAPRMLRVAVGEAQPHHVQWLCLCLLQGDAERAIRVDV